MFRHEGPCEGMSSQQVQGMNITMETLPYDHITGPPEDEPLANVYKGTQERQLHSKAEAGLCFYKPDRKPGKEGQ